MTVILLAAAAAVVVLPRQLQLQTGGPPLWSVHGKVSLAYVTTAPMPQHSIFGLKLVQGLERHQHLRQDADRVSKLLIPVSSHLASSSCHTSLDALNTLGFHCQALCLQDYRCLLWTANVRVCTTTTNIDAPLRIQRESNSKVNRQVSGVEARSRGRRCRRQRLHSLRAIHEVSVLRRPRRRQLACFPAGHRSHELGRGVMIHSSDIYVSAAFAIC